MNNTLDSKSVTRSPNKSVRALRPYRRSSQDLPIDLRLDANEGPLADKSLVNLLEPEFVRSYPSRTALQNAIAGRMKISLDQVIVTAGGDEAIDRMCRAYLEPGRNIVIPEPTFSMIRQYATIAGAEVRPVMWQDDFPVDELIETADDETAVVAVVTPNNPTGQTVSLEQINRLAEAIPNAILLIDQAYTEFEDDPILIDALLGIPNAVVVRTFSKAWGLAGLRVGFAVGKPEIIEWMNVAGSPYPVAGPSLAVAAGLIEKLPNGNENYISLVRKERRALEALFVENGFNVIPSQGNFVYVPCDESRLTATLIYRALMNFGIQVRSFDSQNALRITCPGNMIAFERLLKTLRTVLQPQAILFDMDGVLVDESPSYREAILETCKAFGESFDKQEIAEKKLLGNANNDWIFTYQILQQRGVDVSFDQVKATFEAILQGTDETPGLWQREKRLVNVEWLKKLADRFPLGIVTGRPRSDAIRFLENHDIRQLFSAIVCLEDGPAKPDPANVITALKELKVRNAWMVGDTPDDINAARSAGVVPLGIVAPEDTSEYSIDKLDKASAVCILQKLESLSEMLP